MLSNLEFLDRQWKRILRQFKFAVRRQPSKTFHLQQRHIEFTNKNGRKQMMINSSSILGQRYYLRTTKCFYDSATHNGDRYWASSSINVPNRQYVKYPLKIMVLGVGMSAFRLTELYFFEKTVNKDTYHQSL